MENLMPTDPADFSATVERFSGFADLYDKYRPTPPEILADVVLQMAQIETPQLIVDLGSGTGLATRYWATKAAQVIGIEPSADMRRQAAAQTDAQNVSYREGFSHQTGLPDHCAEVVACSQALHWMEPQSTFEEARRILRPGGVFVACDYDWPPTTSNWEADQAYRECHRQIHTIEKQFESQIPRVKRWEKDQHLARMQASGCFRYTKEILLHHSDQGNAERLVGLLFSQGGVMTLVKNGYSEEVLGIDKFREKAQRLLGNDLRPWIWSARVRVGVVEGYLI
jgi:ubiquinone/menaquinone biosynthesis C-methylase UbiE